MVNDKKKRLLFSIFFLILLLGSVSAFDWTNGTIAYYSLNETAGTGVNDSTGNYNGTCLNCEGNEWNASGKVGYARQSSFYTDPSEGVAISDNAVLDSIQSISFWYVNLQTNASGGEGRSLVGKEDDTNATILFVDSSGSAGTLSFFLSTAGASTISIGNVQKLVWHHIVLTISGTNATVYLDGAQNSSANTASTTAFSNNKNLTIGGNPANGRGMVGLIDEVGLWNRTLTVSEVGQLYNSGNGISYGITAGSVAVTLNSPLNNSQITTNATIYNASSTPTTHDLINATIYVWDSSLTTINITTNSLTGSVYNSTIWNISLPFPGNYLWNVKGCIGNGIGTNCSFASDNFTIRYVLLSTDNMTYNPVTYETENEQFIANISTAGLVPTNAFLVYNTTIVSATLSSMGGNSYGIFAAIDIPTGLTNNSFYFNFTLGGIESMTDSFQQTVATANLTMKSAGCSTGSLTYLNFTFQDEANLSSLKAQNDLTEVTFWLGGGSITKSLITSNITANKFYDFCFDPQNRTVSFDLTFKYSATGYPQRTFIYTNQSFTSITTNKTLYLLSTSDGIYSSFSVIETSGGPIQGAAVIVERQFSGVWVTVGQDTTGSDGIATFWVNPNFPHRITVTKTGYTSSQVTITPSQSLYTMTLSKISGASAYTSPIAGLLYAVQPRTGTIHSGTYNFNVTVTSSEANLENCKFELTNASNLAVLATNTGFTNSSYCFVNVVYTVIENQNFFGRLSVDTTETTGFVIVNADWKWISMDIDVFGWRTITSFFSDIKDISEFGDPEGNEAEFSRFIIFFVLTTLVLGMFIHFTGVELNNPGITIVILWLIAFLASAGGFLTFNSGAEGIGPWFEQYGFFFVFTMYVVGYILGLIRRSQQ